MRESDWLATTIDATIALHERVKRADPQPVVDAAAAIARALRRAEKIIFGNGGSAADAQMAAELVGHSSASEGAGGSGADADASDDGHANDYGFERVFARQIRDRTPGDVALGITTSGTSANVAGAAAGAG